MECGDHLTLPPPHKALLKKLLLTLSVPGPLNHDFSLYNLQFSTDTTCCHHSDLMNLASCMNMEQQAGTQRDEGRGIKSLTIT